MSQLAARRALVIGGSISGLFSALTLLRQGWDVQVFERAETELSARGAGIITQPQLLQTLRMLGLNADDSLGVDVSRRRTLDKQGHIIAELVRPQIATSWNTLFGILRRALPDGCYHLNKDLVAISQNESSVTATFSDRSEYDADLLIGADGFRSKVREIFQPQVRPIYAGYVAWRGLVDEATLLPETHRMMFNYFTFGLPPNEQILGYPVAGNNNDTQEGRRRYNFVWYRPTDETTELARLLTDESGRRHDISIPPPLIARSAIAEIRDHARRTFAPQFSELVRLSEQPFFQPIYDLEAEQMAFGRVALIGDAAFVARPHIGAGTAKAADDAVALGTALAGEHDITSALKRYADERLPIGRKIVRQGRRLGAYMQREFANENEQQHLEALRSPQSVMAETAMLDFLQQ